MFERYAIFYCPTSALAEFGSAWLGWDSRTGRAVDHPDMDGLDVAALTKTPRKYGLHGTLKAPFYLVPTCTLSDLEQSAERFAASHTAIDIGALSLRNENGFVALRPDGPQSALRNFAADVVRHFDPLRAPLSDADIARRRKSHLTPQQDAQLLEWGYPYVFDDFHFHLTLSGRIKPAHAVPVIDALLPRIAPLLPDPFLVEAITITGQDAQGMFHQIRRYPLTG